MRKKKSRLLATMIHFCKKLGPGIITGASDDDPSGIATYSQAGAQFGLATLWTALITFPLMLSIQEMCGRIGMATSKGLTTNIKIHYSKIFLLILLVNIPAIILNIGADIAAMGAVANLVFPSIHSSIFSGAFTLILLVLIIFLSYEKIVSILKYLCLSLLLYLIIPFLVKQDWLNVLKHTFIPTIQWNKEYLSILVAILGTTISPYLFFWQATMEAEGNRQNNGRKRNIKSMQRDIRFGMLTSNTVMYFIILTTGTILYGGGIHSIETVEQAAKALEPLAGHLSSLLFAIGIIATGFLAIPVLAGSLSYILSTIFNLKTGLDKDFYTTKPFYIIIIVSLFIGFGLNFIGLSPIKALIYTATFYGLTAPFLIALILDLANNKKVMGPLKNGLGANIIGVSLLLLMTVSAGLLIFFQFFN